MIVIVLGMHRSGTSALAGVLSNNGVYMGDETNFMPKPNSENPKGFFENKEFRIVNDSLLNENGYKVKDFSTSIPHPYHDMACSDINLSMMQSRILKFTQLHKVWGFKDHRTCLTLRFWREAIDLLGQPYKTVLMLRNNMDVALSMQRRGNPGSLHRLAELANVYSKHARLQARDFLEVNFNDLIYKTDNTLKVIGDYLDVPLENDGFIEERLANRV